MRCKCLGDAPVNPTLRNDLWDLAKALRAALASTEKALSREGPDTPRAVQLAILADLLLGVRMKATLLMEPTNGIPRQSLRREAMGLKNAAQEALKHYGRRVGQESVYWRLEEAIGRLWESVELGPEFR